MHLSPLATFGFPQTTPGPHKHIGYAYVKSSPLSHYFRASPVLRTDSQSALKIEEVAYSVYYPSTVTSRGWFGGSAHWVPWLPEPVGEIVAGYERFIGTRGVGWICESPMST